MSEGPDSRRPLNWPTTLFIVGTSLGALAWPVYAWFFGVSGAEVALALAYFVATGMAITVGYHRLISHRTFECRAWMKAVLLAVGAAAWQGSALEWASDHLVHHAHTDTEADPYNIKEGFWHAHIGWLFRKRPLSENPPEFLTSDRLIMFQHRFYIPIAVTVSFLIPLAICGIGGLLLAGVVRVVVGHHTTWLINSWAHTGGSRPYNQEVSAVDNWLVAFFTFGEGWHNYHHSFPSDYRNGTSPLAWDPSKWAIAVLSVCRVTWGLQRVGVVSRWRQRVRNTISHVGEDAGRAGYLRSLKLALEKQRLHTSERLERKMKKLAKLEIPAYVNAIQLRDWLSQSAGELKASVAQVSARRLARVQELANAVITYDRLMAKLEACEQHLCAVALAPTAA